MKAWILIILISMIPFQMSKGAQLIDCEKHPIYCQIIKNQPRINKKFAMQVSNIIYHVAVSYSISTDIYTAILMQESGYKLTAKGCHIGLRDITTVEYDAHVKECNDKHWKQALDTILNHKPGTFVSLSPVAKCILDIKRKVKARVCTDFGMSQIYYKTAIRYGINIDRLTTDLRYSIEAGAKVLSGFKKRYSKREINWWTRYNASSKTKRKIYRELVERYLSE